MSTLIGAIALINTAALYLLWRVNPRFHGINFWLYSQFAYTLAWLPGIFANLNIISHPYFIAFNNAMNITAMALMLEGTLRFRDIKPSHRRSVVMLIGLVIAAYMSIINREDMAPRYLFHDLAATCLLSVTGWVLIRKAAIEERAAAIVPTLYLVLMAMAYGTRWILVILDNPDKTLSSVNILLFAFLVLAQLGCAYGLLVAVNARIQWELKRTSLTDTLTGLSNRRFLDTALERALAQRQRQDAGFGLAFFDLDRFKQINDQYGHAAGDLVLTKVADRLRESLRLCDQAARVGGDEFVVLFHNVNDSTALAQAADRLRQSVEGPVMLGPDQVTIRISMGTALAPDNGDTVDALLHHADVGMYADKRWRRQADGLAEKQHCHPPFVPVDQPI